ncbi:MAG: PIN domain-containing protein [Candidatus Aminicenantales bacterium]
MISLLIDAVVADANVILSVLVGKTAQQVVVEHHLQLHMAEFNALEVAEYLPLMAEKYGLPQKLLQMAWKLLPLTIHDFSRYSRQYPAALANLRKRDPEDAHPLALARALRLPLWSNDRHLSSLNVPCYTTAKLLKILKR